MTTPVSFTLEGARKIAKVVTAEGRKPRNNSADNSKRNLKSGARWAKIRENEEYDDVKRYSWVAVDFNEDGEAEEKEDWAKAEHSDESGYVVEASGQELPEDSIVWIRPHTNRNYYVAAVSGSGGAPVTFETFNYEPGDDDKNAYFTFDSQTRVRVSTAINQGVVLAGDSGWAIPYNGNWYNVAPGRVSLRLELNEDMANNTTTGCDATPLDGNNPIEDATVLVHGNGDLTGMKSGMKVTAVWEKNRYVVVDMDNRTLWATLSGGMLGGYPATVGPGINFAGSVQAVGQWVDGRYLIISATCAELEEEEEPPQ